MSKSDSNISRRDFMSQTGKAVAGAALVQPLSGLLAQQPSGKKMRIAIVGTGVRGIGMYGLDVSKNYGDLYVILSQSSYILLILSKTAVVISNLLPVHFSPGFSSYDLRWINTVNLKLSFSDLG